MHRVYLIWDRNLEDSSRLTSRDRLTRWKATLMVDGHLLSSGWLPCQTSWVLTVSMLLCFSGLLISVFYILVSAIDARGCVAYAPPPAHPSFLSICCTRKWRSNRRLWHFTCKPLCEKDHVCTRMSSAYQVIKAHENFITDTKFKKKIIEDINCSAPIHSGIRPGLWTHLSIQSFIRTHGHIHTCAQALWSAKNLRYMK